jgi:hypothetical protein
VREIAVRYAMDREILGVTYYYTSSRRKLVLGCNRSLL